MELVEGGDLENYLNKQKSQNLDQVVRFFMQMVAVVFYLTSNRIVHRDLNLANF
jgi:serine/threonine protein kinase